MISNTIDILDLLTDAGMEQSKAKPLAKELLTRTEARETLMTREHFADEMRKMAMWIATIMFAQLAAITAIVTLLFSIYS